MFHWGDLRDGTGPRSLQRRFVGSHRLSSCGLAFFAGRSCPLGRIRKKGSPIVSPDYKKCPEYPSMVMACLAEILVVIEEVKMLYWTNAI